MVEHRSGNHMTAPHGAIPPRSPLDASQYHRRRRMGSSGYPSQRLRVFPPTAYLIVHMVVEPL
jgi:hypothetical protein